MSTTTAAGATAKARPVSGTTYDALCKYILRKRLTRVLSYSAIASWVLITLSTWELFGSPLHFVRLHTLLWCFVAFAVGVVPPLVMRKLMLAPRKHSYPNLGTHIRSLLASPSAWQFVFVHQVSASAIAVCFVLLSAQSTKISIFKPTTLYPWHLNERFVYLLGSNVLLGTAYAVRALLTQGTAVQWPLRRGVAVSTRIQTRFPSTLLTTLTLSAVYSTCFIALYLVFRRSAFSMLLFIARPFIYNFVRSKLWGLSLSVTGRLFALNLTTSALWTWSQTLFSVYATQPLTVSQYTANPTDCMISGISCQAVSGYYQHFAISELAEIAHDPKFASRRKAIFSDLRTPQSTSAWAVTCRQLLLVLGKDYQNLLNRGKSHPVSPSQPPPAAPQPTLPKTPTALRKAEYAPIQRSPTERFLDGIEYSINTADVALNHLPKIIDHGTHGVATLSRSLSSRQAQTTKQGHDIQTGAQVVPAKPASFMNNWVANKSAPLVTYYQITRNVASCFYRLFTDETVERKLELSLPDVAMNIWAITAISNLAARSFEEDPYGTVQRDIPKILEALLLFQDAVDQLKAELRDDKADTWIEPVRDALGAGLHEIISKFRDRLSAFRFPPRIAKRLQDVVDLL
ncbi:hypothetical protein FRB99_002930 [Tulasnella sp. 403]|nr:hypothetical protein FRB99_002930 [Tulasnella sp. 403]